MGSLTNFSETESLDHLCGTSYSPGASVYVALCTADPTDAATGASMNEVANSGSYARTAIAWSAAAARAIVQNGDVQFPTATGSWGTVSHWALVDSNTYGSGNVLAHGAFSQSKAVATDDQPTIPSTEIQVSFSAGEFSNYAAIALLDWLFRAQAFTAPSTYVGFTTATVSDSDTGSSITEVSGGSYARVQVNANGGAVPDWDAAVSGDPSFVDNNDAITFAQATADWGTVTSLVICDAATLGNLLWYDNDVTDKAVNNGDTASIAAGALDVQMS